MRASDASANIGCAHAFDTNIEWIYNANRMCIPGVQVLFLLWSLVLLWLLLWLVLTAVIVCEHAFDTSTECISNEQDVHTGGPGRRSALASEPAPDLDLRNADRDGHAAGKTPRSPL